MNIQTQPLVEKKGLSQPSSQRESAQPQPTGQTSLKPSANIRVLENAEFCKSETEKVSRQMCVTEIKQLQALLSKYTKALPQTYWVIAIKL